jgi:biopolymer transport protein ExbD
VRDIASLKKTQKTNETSLPLNVVAERTTSYRVIFDVLKGMREVGFANMLFVSRLEEGKQ